MSGRSCPALLTGAPASGSGKTAFSAGLARQLLRQGRRVRVFKVGPDFLDPMILSRASGAPVYQLDLWMMGEAHCRELLYRAAGEADVILVEGVMGLHDGLPSSAELAALFDLPVLFVIDAAAMAQTFGAVALGLALYRPALATCGVVANNVAGEAHAGMLRESLPVELTWCGWVARDLDFGLPERHLGLLQADEIDDLEQRLDGLAAAVAGIEVDISLVTFRSDACADTPRLLEGVRIAVARDGAFAFLYQANLDLLAAMGAELVEFSVLADETLPSGTDSVFLPGGYPELHLPALVRNTGIRAALQAHWKAGRPLYAECGGMMALFEQIIDLDGNEFETFSLLPGRVRMQERLVALGLQEIALPEGTLRGHTFHYSRAETDLVPLATGRPQRAGRRGEPVYRVGRLTASYLHLYFPSNPSAVARLFHPDAATLEMKA